MNPKKETYQDDGKAKWFYIAHINVVCPKCSKQAILKTPNQNQKEPELKCSNCYYSKSGYEYSTFHNIQKIACKNCNTIYNLETKDLPTTIKKTNSICPDCQTKNQVLVEFHLHNVGGMYNSQAISVLSSNIFFNLKQMFKSISPKAIISKTYFKPKIQIVILI